jgi:hypothetical protein
MSGERNDGVSDAGLISIDEWYFQQQMIRLRRIWSMQVRHARVLPQPIIVPEAQDDTPMGAAKSSYPDSPQKRCDENGPDGRSFSIGDRDCWTPLCPEIHTPINSILY